VDALFCLQRSNQFSQEKDALYRLVESTLMKTDWKSYIPTLVRECCAFGNLKTLGIHQLTPWIFLLASLACVFGSTHVVVHLVGSLLMALFWHQSAWIGHDTCHNSVINSRRTSHLIGVVYGNLMTGVSAGWWKYTHNMHHVTTNEWDKDPVWRCLLLDASKTLMCCCCCCCGCCSGRYTFATLCCHREDVFRCTRAQVDYCWTVAFESFG
jgi:hypothetical protein